LSVGSIIQVDLTSKCNLSCDFCYLNWRERAPDLGEDEMLKLLGSYRDRYGTRLCIYLGGEPLLRPSLLLKCVELFGRNWVVTNGCLPVPELSSDCIVWFSVDGDRETHDALRGRGVYDRAKTNAEACPSPVGVTTLLNRFNWRRAPKVLEEWCELAAAFLLNLHTPPPSGFDKFVLFGEERRRCIALLKGLKAEYGDLIIGSEAMYDSMLSGDLRGRCALARKYMICLNSAGKEVEPCGLAGDCRICGLHCAHALTLLAEGRADEELVRCFGKIL